MLYLHNQALPVRLAPSTSAMKLDGIAEQLTALYDLTSHELCYLSNTVTIQAAQ